MRDDQDVESVCVCYICLWMLCSLNSEDISENDFISASALKYLIILRNSAIAIVKRESRSTSKLSAPSEEAAA